MVNNTTTSRRRTMDSGYRPLPVGTKHHPWPTTERGEETDATGNIIRTFGLGVIQSETDPLWLHSAREYAHVMPELLRNMPVPSMLEAFEAILKSPLVYLESDPAYGKSYLANLVGNAIHPKGAVIYDAGGKNLESLLFETVFDSNANSDLIDRINSGLRNGTLTEPSLNALRELKAKNSDGEGKPLLSEEGDKKVFDWEGLKTSGIPREELDSVLSSVQKYQEWNGGLRIGFKDVDGALIRAAIEHRPLVIDEFARRKLGSEAALQQVWQVINGEIEQLPIPLGNLGEFTLHHGDIPKVIMTSNKPKDGVDVNPISDSLESRLVKKEIPAFTEEDWAHRISQVLTGVPVTTLARLEKGYMADGPNPEDAKWVVADDAKFRKNLESIHTTGVPAAPPLQTKLLDNWKQVINVSNALARAYHQSAAILDPESSTLQQPSMASIRFEVDKPGDKAQKLTPRTTLRTLREAILRMAESVPATQTKGADFSSWDTPQIALPTEPVEAKIGSRIKKLAELWIDDVAGVTVDGAKRPKLYNQLRAIWTDAGILGDNSVLDQLNIGNKKFEPVSGEVQMAKDVIDQLLKTKYPDYDGVSPQLVETFLKSMAAKSAQRIGEEMAETHILSIEPDNVANARFTNTATVASRSKDAGKPGGTDFKDFIAQHPPHQLVEVDRVISTLALPYIGKELLQAISKMSDGSASVPGASYSDSSNLVITTTIAKTANDKYAKLHVIHNKADGHTLVVTFDGSQVKMPKDSKLTIADASGSKVKATVKKWLDEHAAGEDASMRAAFAVRNAVPDDKTSEKLETLLTDKEIRTFSPTMVDGKSAAAARI